MNPPIDFGYSPAPGASAPTPEEAANIRSALGLGTAVLEDATAFTVSAEDVSQALHLNWPAASAALFPVPPQAPFTDQAVLFQEGDPGTLDITARDEPVSLDLYRLFPVARIASYAFYGCHSDFPLRLPSTITQIGSYAFAYMSTAAPGPLIFPDTLTSIGSYAFAFTNFSGFIYLPHSLTDIGTNALTGCAGLTEMYADVDASVLNGQYPPDLEVIYYNPARSGWTNPWNGIPCYEWVSVPLLPTP